MRLATIRNPALFSVLGLTSAQSSASTWAQTQPFNVDVSTESLLSSSQQALTNIVGTNTPSSSALPPAVSITDSFSASIPTELSTVSRGSGTSVVTVTPSSGASASASASAERSRSASASAASSGASSSAASIPSGAAAPAGVGAQQKVLGVAGVLAGAAGVLFV